VSANGEWGRIAKKGFQYASDAVWILLNGDDGENPYKDPRIDTSKSFLERLDTLSDDLTLDYLLRLHFEAAVAIIVNKRPDLLEKEAISIKFACKTDATS
jgi:hypothetical protein